GGRNGGLGPVNLREVRPVSQRTRGGPAFVAVVTSPWRFADRPRDDTLVKVPPLQRSDEPGVWPGPLRPEAEVLNQDPGDDDHLRAHRDFQVQLRREDGIFD